jgi:hypothetical protein
MVGFADQCCESVPVDPTYRLLNLADYVVTATVLCCDPRIGMEVGSEYNVTWRTGVSFGK